jgi:hypothetical protein
MPTMQPPLLRRVRTLALLTLVAAALAAPAQASAAAGFRDFSWSAASMNGPTAHKPQSKLWFNDGEWWGYMFDRASDSWHIHRLNRATQVWTDTGTAVDTRNATWADVLWDGSKLYIASAGASAANSADSARLYRYSYNPATKQYTADAGFPSTIVTGGMEAIVLDKDSTGKLWATYTRDSRVYVNDSSVGGGAWGTPFVVPVSGTTVSADDISTIIRYNGRIGVMWSNQVSGAVSFASHADGAARTSWGSVSVPLQGTRYADDHLSIRSIEADSAGRLYAVVKTSLNDGASPNPADPQFIMLRLNLAGSWDKYTVSRVSDKQTRPIIMLDDRNRKVYIFFTTSTNGATIDSGTAETAIYYKSSGMDSPSFATGRGTPAIELDTDRHINDVTSTKQNVNGASGLVLLASDNASKFYMHGSISLGSPAVPTVKLAAASDTGRSATDGITSDTTPGFTGTAPAGSTVSVRDGSATLGSATADSSGAWSFQSPALAQGEHPISAVVGSATSTVLGVTVDTTAPSAPAITSPADGATVAGPTVAVSGTTGAGQDVAVRDGTSAVASSTATSTGAWSANATLAAGGHTLTATTADLAGNVSSASPAVRVTVSGTSSGPIFSDGFESGSFSAWSASATGGDGTATVQGSIVRTGQFAARLTESGNAGSFAKVTRSLGASQKDVTVSLDIRIDAEGPSGLVVPIVRVYDGAGTRLLSLYRRNANFNGVGVSNAGATYNTSGSLPLGTWRRYSVRLVAAGAGASTVTVAQDGAQIFTTTTANLGTSGAASIQLGNENAAQPFTLEADGVQVTTG